MKVPAGAVVLTHRFWTTAFHADPAAVGKTVRLGPGSATIVGIALLIAVVGAAGVLASLVSARTREFGVRMAVGSSPRDLLAGVVKDGVRIAAFGIAAGAAGGFALARAAEWFFGEVQQPGALSVVGAAAALVVAAIVASRLPAARARHASMSCRTFDRNRDTRCSHTP